jgi:hypothetical protein
MRLFDFLCLLGGLVVVAGVLLCLFSSRLRTSWSLRLCSLHFVGDVLFNTYFTSYSSQLSLVFLIYVRSRSGEHYSFRSFHGLIQIPISTGDARLCVPLVMMPGRWTSCGFAMGLGRSSTQ